MRTFTLLILASFVLAACGGTPAPAGTAPTSAAAVYAARTEVIPTQTPWVVTATSAPAEAEGQTEMPEPTETLAPTTTGTPLPTSTLAPVGLQLRTATDMRAFGRVIGWVTGGANGEFVQGAQIALKSDFALKTLPEGYVFEFECVQYTVMNGEVTAKPVCEGALIRFGTNSIVPAGSIGTLWLSHAVVGSETELWEEGFLNLPCKCPDGDCRDE